MQLFLTVIIMYYVSDNYFDIILIRKCLDILKRYKNICILLSVLWSHCFNNSEEQSELYLHTSIYCTILGLWKMVLIMITKCGIDCPIMNNTNVFMWNYPPSLDSYYTKDSNNSCVAGYQEKWLWNHRKHSMTMARISLQTCNGIFNLRTEIDNKSYRWQGRWSQYFKHWTMYLEMYLYTEKNIFLLHKTDIITFRWKIWLAFSFVRPVHHKRSKPTKASSDFIYNKRIIKIHQK